MSRQKLEQAAFSNNKLAHLQYINGYISYLDVLDAQRGYFDAQISLSDAILRANNSHSSNSTRRWAEAGNKLTFRNLPDKPPILKIWDVYFLLLSALNSQTIEKLLREESERNTLDPNIGNKFFINRQIKIPAATQNLECHAPICNIMPRRYIPISQIKIAPLDTLV